MNNYEDYQPSNNLEEQELDLNILKLGSFLSIIQNRKCNQVKLLLVSLNDDDFCEVCLKLTDLDCKQMFVSALLARYPTISKSKLVYNSLCP